MAKGWVSLNREITSHWVWDCEFSYGQAWVDLILNACHSENKLMIKGQLILLERGQQARSELTLSKTWKWSRNKVRRFLNNLEKDNMIETKKGHLTSVITICNYDTFQSNGTTGDTTKGQQTIQQKDNRRDTNNNVNNGNNVNNKDIDQQKADRQFIERAFNFFWDHYGRKVGKDAAVKAFEKIMKPKTKIQVKELTEHIIAKRIELMEKWKQDPENMKGFNVLHASTFLNNKRWEDEL